MRLIDIGEGVMFSRLAILYALLFSAPVWGQDGFYPATTSTVTSLQKVIDAFNSLNNDPTTHLSFVPAAPPSGDTFLQGTGLGNSVLLKVKEFESNALPGINALFDGDSGCLAWNEDYASGINTPRRLYTLIHELIHNAVATNYPEFFAEIDTCSCAAPPPPDPDPCGDGPLDPAADRDCYPCYNLSEIHATCGAAKYLCCALAECPPFPSPAPSSGALEGALRIAAAACQAIQMQFPDAEAECDMILPPSTERPSLPPSLPENLVGFCEPTPPGEDPPDPDPCDGCEELAAELDAPENN